MANPHPVPLTIKPKRPGNIHAGQREKYRRDLYKCVSREDWKEINRVAVEQAKDGDYQARKYLAEYLIGKPTQPLEVSASDALFDSDVERAVILEVLANAAHPDPVRQIGDQRSVPGSEAHQLPGTEGAQGDAGGPPTQDADRTASQTREVPLPEFDAPGLVPFPFPL